MTIASKTCAACGNPFYRIQRISNDRWRQQKTCSRPCSVVYRKRRESGNHITPPQARERARTAMARKWEVQKAIAAAKASPISARPTREDEVEAIARFVAERGVKRLDPVEGEFIQARQEMHRPQPMAGWRG